MSRTVDESYAGSVLVAVRRRSVARRIKDLLSALAVTSATDNPAHLTQPQNELWTLISTTKRCSKQEQRPSDESQADGRLTLRSHSPTLINSGKSS
ncbi:hypothetical protein [Streptomyces gossypiisoli]|uniref:hypothetical protein n=1 Tax=Streptomyces gossypiisoli TaxID=2748864 RepID=UPI0015DB1F8D|nr:hypothetical protein [Streptomyces gossypiisoli]